MLVYPQINIDRISHCLNWRLIKRTLVLVNIVLYIYYVFIRCVCPQLYDRDLFICMYK